MVPRKYYINVDGNPRPSMHYNILILVAMASGSGK
jgi:hypothetical protein